MHTTTRMALALVALGWSACGEDAPATPSEPTAPEGEAAADDLGTDGPQSAIPLAELMQAHFVEATQARDAVIRGDVDGAQAAFRELAELEPAASYPPSWRPQLGAFSSAATAAAAGADLDALALATGNVANACAGCHDAVGAEVELAVSVPPEGDDTATHMQRHQWALDRMWEGLMVPDHDRYTAGAGALVEATLAPESIAEGQTVGAEVASLAERVHELGRNASAATDETQRAQHYGELLQTCASCHRQLPGAPGNPVPLGG